MQDVKSLIDAGDFGSFGRYEEVAVAQMSPTMKEAYEYTMQLRGVVPGPHKIWLANQRFLGRSCRSVLITRSNLL
jgi:hypothetical protein